MGYWTKCHHGNDRKCPRNKIELLDVAKAVGTTPTTLQLFIEENKADEGTDIKPIDFQKGGLQGKGKTRRDRPKSAPLPRLKNSKKTSKCQVFSFTVLENRKLYEKKFSKKLHTQKNGPSGAPGPASASPGCAERGHVRNCQHFCHS